MTVRTARWTPCACFPKTDTWTRRQRKDPPTLPPRDRSVTWRGEQSVGGWVGTAYSIIRDGFDDLGQATQNTMFVSGSIDAEIERCRTQLVDAEMFAIRNTCVRKPAPDTPWNAARLGRLVARSAA